MTKQSYDETYNYKKHKIILTTQSFGYCDYKILDKNGNKISSGYQKSKTQAKKKAEDIITNKMTKS